MSILTVEPGQRSPELGLLGENRKRPAPTARQALAVSHVPLAISGTVWWLFFMAYWIPEFHNFPGGDFLLTQLSPLAAPGITTQGNPVVALQVDRSGAMAAYLLLAALAIPPLTRTRYWLARLSLMVISYAAVVAVVVSVLGILVRGQVQQTVLGLIGLVVWLVTALVTSWRSLWVDVNTLPIRPKRALWLLPVYVLFVPAPLAVGRWLFSPELRDAAVSVLDSGLTLRWAALLTPISLPLYLSGVMVGVLAACLYAYVPPRWPGTRRRTPIFFAAAALVTLLITSTIASAAAPGRVERLATASPADDVSFSCGHWVNDEMPGEPARTLIVTGARCDRATSYAGYRRTGGSPLDGSLLPIRANQPDETPITSRYVAALYDDIVVMATTTRLDARPNGLVAVRLSDGGRAWSFTCADHRPFGLRFAGGDDPADPAAGRITRVGEPDSINVACDSGSSRLDPTTGVPVAG
ncbi:hypothetical protein [Microlunatus ginsengisoli]|uniref:Uncharacterized protein n=1 Tax=Microlunatus ginsengisoli TaxID=363863 RepID=A0ABP6ZNG4_9ACTN